MIDRTQPRFPLGPTWPNLVDHPSLVDGAPWIDSLGAGIQSTTISLLQVDGVLPKPAGAIFADTGWEPAAVYQHLERLAPVLEAAGIPVHVVSVGNIRSDALDPAHRFASMPLFTQEQPWTCQPCGGHGVVERPAFDLLVDDPDDAMIDCAACGGAGGSDGEGMVRRQCTSEYKLKPIRAEVRRQLGAPVLDDGRVGRVPGRPGSNYAWNVVGISADEVVRIKPSDVLYLKRVDPLVDLLPRPWSRSDCEGYLADRWPWPVPRSACVGCPFHDNLEWRDMRDNDPVSWADAVAFDRALRGPYRRAAMPHLRGLAYLHADRVPLDQADIDKPSKRELAATQGTLDLFGPPGCDPYGCGRSSDVDIPVTIGAKP